MVSLQLKGCKYCNQLPPLGQLPQLKELRIIKFDGLVTLGSEFYGSGTSYVTKSFPTLEILSCDSLKFLPLDHFPSLKSLDVWGCKNLEALTVSESDVTTTTLNSLQFLCVRHCPNFMSFPKGGFAAPKLTLLTINYCDKLNSLPEKMHHLMPNLKELQLQGCPKIESSTMTTLKIKICNKLNEGKQNHSDPLFARLEGLASAQSPSSS
ncbi:hypothetical protein TanjilG_19290 [Lupinus angustifolius]|uniref:Uncharacterized protein n=1 Tax=Lupinus angustifolius TaxID=3871 RepID=A0A1J7HYR7_LUPAN|nr:hypothetical protein TanjilG_19290 [Lupinus angustifolius]